VDSKSAQQSDTGTGYIAVMATLLLAVCWSASALGRTHGEVDCNDAARRLQEPGTPVESLALRQVDHVLAEPDVDAFELKTAADNVATPLLDLKPSVTSSLHDIFDDNRHAAMTDTVRAIPASPLAESGKSEEVPDIAELPGETEPSFQQLEEENDLPLLQREMYRIDI